MDHNIIFNVVRFSDHDTAKAILKAGGAGLFEAAHALGVVKDIDYRRGSYMEVIFTVLNKFNEKDIIAAISLAFWAIEEMFMGVSEELANQYKQVQLSPPRHGKNFFVKGGRPYVSALKGHGHNYMIFGTRRASFLEGLTFLKQLERDGMISVERFVRTSMGEQQLLTLKDSKCLNVRFTDDILLPVKEVDHRLYENERREVQTLCYMPAVSFHALSSKLEAAMA